MIRTTGDATKRNRPSLIILAPVFALIALFCWSISSPVGSSPDDDYHLASIWCGLGNRPGVCESVAAHPTERAVPLAVAKAPKCYRFYSDKSAQCQNAYIGDNTDMVATVRGNFYSAAYPPVYYWFMSLFVGPNVVISALVMRTVSIVLFLGLTTILYVLLPVIRRSTLLWSLAVTLVPLGVFLIASNNPSGWSVISAGTLWLALVGYFETRGRRRIALAAVAGIAVLMGAGSRADSAVYSVIAVAAAVVLTLRRDRKYVLSLILPVLLTVAAFLFYLSGRQSGVASGGFSQSAQARSVGALIWENFMELPALWAGSFGHSQLGWLDTPMPAMVWVLAIGCFSAVVFVGLGSMSIRKLLVTIAVAVALWSIPMWILFQSKAVVGEQVQARYILPLLVLGAGVALYQVASRPIAFTRVHVILVIAALSAANSVALHVNIRRYTTGLGVVAFNLDANHDWWWDAMVSPMLVWAIGTVAFAAAVAVALWTVSRRETDHVTNGVLGAQRFPIRNVPMVP